MKVYEFTIPQLEYYRTFCNFDEKELAVFNLRSKNMSLQQCTEVLKRERQYEYDEVKKISRRVNSKIIKMTNVKRMEEWIENVYWKNLIQNQ